MSASAARARKPRARAARSSMPARLPALGVFGFDRLEPVILAALVTEDPLLLIGRSGTGKTYLLNTLSEALELEHRHYNASLIAWFPVVSGDSKPISHWSVWAA
jgi:MoxR-like ATPase